MHLFGGGSRFADKDHLVCIDTGSEKNYFFFIFNYSITCCDR